MKALCSATIPYLRCFSFSKGGSDLSAEVGEVVDWFMRQEAAAAAAAIGYDTADVHARIVLMDQLGGEGIHRCYSAAASQRS